MIRSRTDPASFGEYVLEVVTDPAHIARSAAQAEKFDRNSRWLKGHWSDVLPQARGKILVIAGEQPFIGDTPEAAWALARAAHPEDNGAFGQYVPANTLARIYANHR